MHLCFSWTPRLEYLCFTKVIIAHAEYGRKLYWFSDANDADLRLFYQRAQALVFPSFAEGFGMPLVEALYYGASVIASDIPVFREVGGAEVRYFSLLDADSLRQHIVETEKTIKKKIDRCSLAGKSLPLNLSI